MKKFKLIACFIVICCMIMCSGCGVSGIADLNGAAVTTADSETTVESNPDTEAAEMETFSLPPCLEFNEVLNSADKLKGSDNIFHLYDIDIDTEDELINIKSCIINIEKVCDEAKLIMAAVYRKEAGEDSSVYARLYIIDILSGKIEYCSNDYDIPLYYPEYMKLEARGDYIILYTHGECDRWAYYFDDTLRLCKDIRPGYFSTLIGYENNDYSRPIFGTYMSVGYSGVDGKHGFLFDGELVYCDEPELNSDNLEQVEYTGFILEDCYQGDFICGGNYLAVDCRESENAYIIYDMSSFEEVYRLDSTLNIMSSYEHTIAVSTDTPFKYSLIRLDTGDVQDCFYNEPVVKFDLENGYVYTESRESDTGIISFKTYRVVKDDMSSGPLASVSYWYGYSQNDKIFGSVHDTTYEVDFYDTRLALNYDSEGSRVEIYALAENGFGDYSYWDSRYTEEYNDLNMIAYERYIEIYYGDEEFAGLPNDYIYKKCEDPAYVECILKLIKKELALYPEEIFDKRYGIKGEKLKIILSEGSLKKTDEGIVAGLYTSDKIIIDISSDRICNTLHHEIWHALEDCGQSMYEVSPLRYASSWNGYNPDGFSYLGEEWKDYSEYTVLAGSEYFVDRYSKKSPKEDRASIFAAAMTGEKNIKETLAVMQPIAGKIEYMEEFLQYVYGCVPYSISFIKGINSESEQPN